jgi:hypothetical protein
MEEEKPPILKTWINVYSLVIGLFIAIIIILYFFTKNFE